ncbi:hypothetical protein PABG_11633 [Paracoccidioides brasiliensis Pb03]|nr:hypothetical protein PABG_11633 [Paracoccidioides brasiliensis Pb03]
MIASPRDHFKEQEYWPVRCLHETPQVVVNRMDRTHRAQHTAAYGPSARRNSTEDYWLWALGTCEVPNIAGCFKH